MTYTAIAPAPILPDHTDIPFEADAVVIPKDKIDAFVRFEQEYGEDPEHAMAWWGGRDATEKYAYASADSRKNALRGAIGEEVKGGAVGIPMIEVPEDAEVEDLDPYCCGVCGRTFTSPQEAAGHGNAHVGEEEEDDGDE